jgi:chromosomal replication initiator protein
MNRATDSFPSTAADAAGREIASVEIVPQLAAGLETEQRNVARSASLGAHIESRRTMSASAPTINNTQSRALLQQARAAFCAHLEKAIGAHRFGLWFGHGTTVECVNGGFRVIAANAYAADWIGRHFKSQLESAAHAVLGAESSVSVSHAPISDDFASTPLNTGDNSPEHPANSSSRSTRTSNRSGNASVRSPLEGDDVVAAAGRPSADEGATRRPRAIDGARAPRAVSFRRLEDFVIGDSNRLAHAASVQVGDAIEGAPSILFLHGECGVGKTHLLQGLCRRRQERSARQVIRYVTAEQFTNEYIASVREGSLEQFRKRLRRVDLLAIDDIHFLANKTATQAEFLHTIDAIDLSGSTVALVSDEHPRHIRRFSQALVSRFLSGMVVKVERPDRNTRVELVRRLAYGRGLTLTTAAEDALAGRCAGSIREIEGMMTRLGALVDLDGVRGQIGPGTVERLLGQDQAMHLGTTPIRLGSIVEAVCSRLRVSREDLIGSGRHGRTVVARGVVAHLARELTTHSYPEIARALGRDTHSAVHTAARRLKSMLDTDAPAADLGESLREVVDQLRHDLSRPAHARTA